MKTAFVLPSCNYNISLNKEDLKKLLETGCITAIVSHTPCSTSRALWNGEAENFEFMSNKNIPNNLFFGLSEPVADIRPDDWNVQFLAICLDDSCKERYL